MPFTKALKIFRDGREICLKTRAGRREYKLRTEEMVARQSHLCPICGLWLSFEDATFEHEDGRGNSGCYRDDRLLHDDGTWRNAALHANCNTSKGSRRYRWFRNLYIPAVYSSAEDFRRGEAA